MLLSHKHINHWILNEFALFVYYVTQEWCTDAGEDFVCHPVTKVYCFLSSHIAYLIDIKMVKTTNIRNIIKALRHLRMVIVVYILSGVRGKSMGIVFDILGNTVDSICTC